MLRILIFLIILGTTIGAQWEIEQDIKDEEEK